MEKKKNRKKKKKKGKEKQTNIGWERGLNPDFLWQSLALFAELMQLQTLI